MKKSLFVLCLFAALVTQAQQRITFVIDSLPAVTTGNIYVAGNFNMWNPADSNFQFKGNTAGASLICNLPQGSYEYKFTRGSWQTVEEQAGYKPMGNRRIRLSKDTIIHIHIATWADANPHKPEAVQHTASPQVKVLDTAFYMPELHRSRRIWIYLPKGYEASAQRYPVLYMHDGQNVFDAATSFSGEWGVDEFLDTLHAGCRNAIVVAVDNGLDKRMNEYNPWAFGNYGAPEGDEYVDFLVKTLKPYIDERFRTLPGRENTSIAGSSMGGLISLYAVLRYPKIFGSAGIFSPAFWTAEGIDSTVQARIGKVDAKLFFYAGGAEGETMLPDMYRIEKEIRKGSRSQIKEVVDADARHNEAAWRKYFPVFYRWVFCE